MDTIDTTRVYNTNAIIKRVGRAIAISVEDAQLPGEVKNKHVTVLFRRLKWVDQEVEAVAKETDNWIKNQYGNNKAPVLFTISGWQKKSVLVHGDLLQLCTHLRTIFANWVGPELQRPAHVALFKRREQKRMRKCENRFSFSPKMAKNGKHLAKNAKNEQKLTHRLQRMIAKTEQLRAAKLEEIQELNETEQMLRNLLGAVPTSDARSIRAELKLMAKNKKTVAKKKCARMRASRFEKRKLKMAQKAERQAAKLARKQAKQAAQIKLNAAVTSGLPPLKSDIGGDTLYVHIDGYNIIGCDRICRSNMRGPRRKAARQRMALLIDTYFMNRLGQFNLEYNNIVTTLWFDGRGNNERYNNVCIQYSGKDAIVDDVLVNTFSVKNEQNNANILVVTSDRQLTMRLYDLGVKVMKSGHFYNSYLNGEHNNNNNNNNNDMNIENKEDEDDDTVMVNVQDTMDKKDTDDQEEGRITDTIEKKISQFLEGEASGTEEESDDDDDDDNAPDVIGNETNDMNQIFGEESYEEDEDDDDE